jgi:hypothetical protein
MLIVMRKEAELAHSIRAQQDKAAPLSRCLLPARTALIFLALLPASTATAGPGQAAAHSLLGTAAARFLKAGDFKVLVWYRKDDSLRTFKYEIYDLRKGEYTPGVDEWIKNVRAKFPAYYVKVRDVDLKREMGESERFKVGSVVKRELFAAAALAGIVIGSRGIGSRSVGSGIFGGASAADSNRGKGLGRLSSSSRVDRRDLGQTTSPYPFPVPILNRPR